MPLLESLSPLSPILNLALVGLAMLTSVISASVGIGGGTLLIIVMAQVMPATALIPVHGMVQLGSNLGRATLTWRHIDRQVIAAFLPGVVLGALAAAWLLIRLPSGVLELAIAAFVLYSCWGPSLPKGRLGKGATLAAGAVTTLLSSLIGASGPLVAAFVKHSQTTAFARVATFAACMSLQHLTKAFVFGVAGFVFRDWLGLMAAMIAAGLLGTWLGLRLLRGLSDKRFDTLFKWMLTLLALRLLWMGIEELVAS
ncbi:Uncharacterized membrane protein YfcA [Modicisalibacter ilicicola DSM 19980]|uniref:Probable membrane transporter protein n=1 Tax=Modicisalibacter ilicicola DSM 19980 TaxID=1121942 RepID=A0A1M4WIS8_9GAMM|nr:sulfite exporter TauE/SafE family protein [Halomonas ilicicola]SHE80973.1 Uncharacterized membrane protein YfcA [Halomonas ilicicola DSM 19980]